MNNLKELREERGKTQKEVFEETGIPIRSIQNWENGKRQINSESAKQLADYFEVNLGYIYGYSKIPNEDYIVDLQDVLHREYELKLKVARLEMENNLLTDENKRLYRDLNDVYIIVEDYRERNHLNG